MSPRFAQKVCIASCYTINNRCCCYIVRIENIRDSIDQSNCLVKNTNSYKKKFQNQKEEKHIPQIIIANNEILNCYFLWDLFPKSKNLGVFYTFFCTCWLATQFGSSFVNWIFCCWTRNLTEQFACQCQLIVIECNTLWTILTIHLTVINN